MEKIGSLEIENGVVLYESKYSKHIYQTSTEILFFDWFLETENMQSEDFEEEIKIWLETTKQCKLLIFKE